MAYVIPSRLVSIIKEADRLAPKRRRSSDGTVGDAAHRTEHSDHNPEDDPGGVVEFIVHAVDISQSMPGLPYWEPGMDEFDVWRHAYQIAHDYVAATQQVRVQRWPWLVDGGYMVWFDGTKDIIFNPSVNLLIRQNGSFKTAHGDAPHCHFSIGHSARSESDTQPIFGEEDDDMTTEAQVEAIVDRIVRRYTTTMIEDNHRILDQTVDRIKLLLDADK